MTTSGDRWRSGRTASVGAALALAAAIACAVVVVMAVGSGAAQGRVPASTTAAGVQAPDTTVDADDANPGGPDVASNTPSPRGEPAPPTAQRVVDSAIAATLLLVLAGGVGVAIWSDRRRGSQR